MRAAIWLVATVAVCGCATAPVSSNAPASPPLPGALQNVTVKTNPPGARCSLRCRGDDVAQVESTPAVATVKRTSCPLEIECAKTGHLEQREIVTAVLRRDSSQISGYGVAAVGVGAGSEIAALSALQSGAATLSATAAALPFALVAVIALSAMDQMEHPTDWHYPPQVELTLIPETFTSEAARDEFLAPFVLRAEEAARSRLEWTCERFGGGHGECIRVRAQNQAAIEAAAWRESIVSRTRVVPP